MIPTVNLLSAVSFLAVYFGIAFQIQITIGRTDDYLGLRVNMADLLLPFAGILVFVSLMAKKSRWPQWLIKYGNSWIVLLCLAMVLANVNHYWIYGEWSRWGLFNKGIGWLVLMSYFALGAWMSTNFGEMALRQFMKSFLLFFIVTIPFFLVPLILRDNGIDVISIGVYRDLAGLMANRNTYGFLLVTCLLFGTLSSFAQKPIISLRWTKILWGMFPIALAYNGSRTSLVVSVIVFAYLLLAQWKNVVKFFGPLAIGTLVLFVFINPSNLSNQFETMDKVFESSEEKIDDRHDKFRLLITRDAFELWQKYPVFGAGLGSFRNYQEEKRGESIDLIHNTALWLLAEMGMVGLSLFIIFYIVCLRALWKNGSIKKDLCSNFSMTTLVFLLLCFAPMSLMHEFFYTRHMWMIMGFAIAVPAAIGATDKKNLNYSSS
jgi:O-antigen ligase